MNIKREFIISHRWLFIKINQINLDKVQRTNLHQFMFRFHSNGNMDTYTSAPYHLTHPHTAQYFCNSLCAMYWPPHNLFDAFSHETMSFEQFPPSRKTHISIVDSNFTVYQWTNTHTFEYELNGEFICVWVFDAAISKFNGVYKIPKCSIFGAIRQHLEKEKTSTNDNFHS